MVVRTIRLLEHLNTMETCRTRSIRPECMSKLLESMGDTFHEKRFIVLPCVSEISQLAADGKCDLKNASTNFLFKNYQLSFCTRMVQTREKEQKIPSAFCAVSLSLLSLK